MSCKEWNTFQKNTKGEFSNSSEAASAYQNVKAVDEMVKGNRPNPSTYLPPSYVDTHLQKFAGGGAYLVPEDILDTYGRDLLGCPDNSQFIMSKVEMDDLLSTANGDIDYIEKELGIPGGSWKGRKLKRIDIPDTKSLDLRMATGNEFGANEEWLAGGHLPTGYSEAAVNQIPKGKYKESDI